MPEWPGFIGGTGVAQTLVGDAEETINFYVETLQNGRKALLSTPGFSPWSLAGVTDVGSRAACVCNGRLFFVIGGGLWEFDVNGTPTKRANIAQDGNPAQLAYAGIVADQLGICSGGNIYCYTLSTNILSAVLLTGGYTHLAYAQGFGLALNPSTGKVNVSKAGDLSTWSAGTFFTRSLFADPYQAMFVDANNIVWLLGSDSFDTRYATTTSADQPFVPLSGLTGRYGIMAPFAFVATGLGNGWLARNPDGVGQFVVTRGSSPQAVSTYSINNTISTFLRNSGIGDAEVVPYQQNGHTFFNVEFPRAQAANPTMPATLSFDVEANIWAKRARLVNGSWELWSPRVHVFAFNKHLIGDRSTGAIYEMDTEVATEIDGSGIACERTAPVITNELQRSPFNQIELWMDTGVGTQTGQGADPQALLSLSIDGGRTYGNERRSGYGPIGRYRQRVYWTRFGSPASSVAKVRFTDPTPKRIVAAFVNNAEGQAA